MNTSLARDRILISKEFIETDLKKIDDKFIAFPVVKYEGRDWSIEHDTVARSHILDQVQQEPGQKPPKTSEIRRFHSSIAGVSFRQNIVEKLTENEELVLEREPGNQYDKNAIKILNKSGEQIGYIKKNLAEKLAPDIDAGKKFKVTVSQLTGLNERIKGVNILFEVV